MSETHNVYLNGAGRDFVLFNDGPLSFEPVGPSDIEPAEIDAGGACASIAWSCGVDWYFIRLRGGLALCNVHSTTAWICRKPSAEFIRLFLDTPAAPARRGRRRSK